MTVLAGIFLLAKAASFNSTVNASLPTIMQLLAAAFGAVIVVLTALVGVARLRPDKNKIIAEASRMAVDAVNDALDTLREELRDATAEVERLKAREQELLKRITELERLAREEARELRLRLQRKEAELADLHRRHEALSSEHARCGR